MKTFQWATVQDWNGESMIFADVTDVGIGLIKTYGTIVPTGGKFRPIIHLNGSGISATELLSLEAAKHEIEKKLIELGIIEDGDMIKNGAEK